jgi:hypothetical protein
MLQKSKILQSRNEWRLKAVQRANENREHRKFKKRYQEKLDELKARLKVLEQTGMGKKNS